MTFQETIAEVLEELVSDASTYDWQSTDYEKYKAEAQATLNKDLRERLEKLKRYKDYGYDPSLGHQKSEDKGFNQAIDQVIQELGLNNLKKKESRKYE